MVNFQIENPLLIQVQPDSLVATKIFFSINESITAAQIVAKLSSMATSAGEKFEQIENCIELNEL